MSKEECARGEWMGGLGIMGQMGIFMSKGAARGAAPGVGDGYFSFLVEEELGGAGALTDNVEARGRVGYALTLKVVVDNRGVKGSVGFD